MIAEKEVFPPDTRASVTRTSAAPYRWICKVRVRYEDPKTGAGGWSEGSGVLISPNFVLTCAHVLMGSGKPANQTKFVKIEVIPGVNNTQKAPSDLYESTSFKVHPNYGKATPRNNLDRNFVNFPWDYGILRLNKPVTFSSRYDYWGKYGNGSLVYLDEKCILGQIAKVAGYSANTTNLLQGDGVVKKITVPNVDAVISSRLFIHLADTEGSQSGAPIWLSCKIGECIIPILIGIHVGGNPTMQMNFGIRLTGEILKNISDWKKLLK
ncbi:MAG: trypsin-like peptidase domain-containing protein [Bacteroidia bacterium]|nr:trypsin-like peptidase domain-containing protein [Bacteroidia bacterium]